jgi:hypothetical protein
MEGVPADLMPAAHAFIDALEDMEREAPDLSTAQLWLRPGGAASVGFHLRHVRGSTDRLLTYARGLTLSDEQLAAIAAENDAGDPPASASELLADLRLALGAAVEQLRAVPPRDLHLPRKVGRAGLPSTVYGLLFHAAEHARRHGGQVVATTRIVRGLGLGI